MKKFLYILSSVRNAKRDRVPVVCGKDYWHDQILAVIEARDAEEAAQALGIKILSSFDRSSVGLPTTYYTSKYPEPSQLKSPRLKMSRVFHLSLREMNKLDDVEDPELKEKLRLRVRVPRLKKVK